MRPVQLVENERVVAYPVVQSKLTDEYTRRALSFLERNQKRPFFLYLPHAMPHKPLAASEEFYTPETREDLYADVIRELDWSVGRILRRISELNLRIERAVHLRLRQRPLVWGQLGRAARHEVDILGRGHSRAPDGPVAGQDPRGYGLGGDMWRNRHIPDAVPPRPKFQAVKLVNPHSVNELPEFWLLKCSH